MVNRLFFILAIILSQLSLRAQETKNVKDTIVKNTDQLILKVSHISYGEKVVKIPKATQVLAIELKANVNALEAVKISTGYYQLSPEKATGSFTLVDEKSLQRNTSPNILQRLEGIVTGMTFDRRNSTSSEEQGKIQVRGESTFFANEDPLIVLDNFPFSGDINQINPADVESITLLKDAAAASIWGARAGNGVFVITTKKGKLNTPVKINFNTSFTRSTQPDLFANGAFLNSAEFIGVERTVFERGYYLANEQSVSKPVLSPVVELLIAKRDNKITAGMLESELARLSSYDVRRDASKYLFNAATGQQYALNIAGGTKNSAYYFSGGYDHNPSEYVGNGRSRLTLGTNYRYLPIDKLEMNFSLNYVSSRIENNALYFADLGTGNGLSPYPYTRLKDDDGNEVSLPRRFRKTYTDAAISSGLLDWSYYPLSEQRLNDNTSRGSDLRLSSSLKYTIIKPLAIELRYQYQQSGNEVRRLRDQQSFFVRDRVNSFTQVDGSRPFPLGGIYYQGNTTTVSENFRGQLNYQANWSDHEISALAGAEVIDLHTTGTGSTIYGYDKEVLTFQLRPDLLTRFPTRPVGSAQIDPMSNSADQKDMTDRFVSYYANAAYTYHSRYTLTGSVRRDASNLFGVATNQKAVPLWSTGISWQISKEPFFEPGQVNSLNLRATYGYNGNIVKSITAFPTAGYSSSSITGYRTAGIQSPGNPDLRWEKVRIVNIGLDLSGKSELWRLRLEGFQKNGEDLIGEFPLDPTFGYFNGSVATYKLNYGSMVTRGLEAELQFNLVRKKNFSWSSNLLFNYVRDKVTRYDYAAQANNPGFVAGLYGQTIVGKSRNSIFSYPWIGLDNEGNPQVEINGVLSKNYTPYLNQLTVEQLKYHGSAVPIVFGSVLNTFKFRNITLSANITYKGGYYFRRTSIAYGNLFDGTGGHSDFTKRWQKPGDEAFTQVPSMPTGAIAANRDLIYLRSELNVEKGDNLRLQDINISYDLKLSGGKMPLRIYLNGNNLGLLWRANKVGLDPDYVSAFYPPSKTYSLGLTLTY